jgi:hypothetical protein
MRPIFHEIGHFYITGDGKKFLDLDEAKSYQSKLERKEVNESKELKEDTRPSPYSPKKQSN